MVSDKTTKIEIGLILVIAVVGTVFIFKSIPRKVEILYFYNPKCRAGEITNDLIEKTEDYFVDKVSIQKFFVNMYENDPEDSEQVKILREEYNIKGVPVIIINGKEFKKKFEWKELKGEICRNIIIKLSVCLWKKD